MGLTSVDRLIAEGLPPVGTHGKAKLYSPTAARALARQIAPRDVATSDMMCQVWNLRANDLRERIALLRAE